MVAAIAEPSPRDKGKKAGTCTWVEVETIALGVTNGLTCLNTLVVAITPRLCYKWHSGKFMGWDGQEVHLKTLWCAYARRQGVHGVIRIIVFHHGRRQFGRCCKIFNMGFGKFGQWLGGQSSSLIDCRSRVQFLPDAKKRGGPLIARVPKIWVF